MSAHYGKPSVKGTALRYRTEKNTYEEIELFSDEWFNWLNSPVNTGFHYQARIGDFTARKEKRRNAHFWYAYRRVYGKLMKKYLGKSEKLTIAFLDQTAKHLATTYEIQSTF